MKNQQLEVPLTMVEVTQADIDRAGHGCYLCPIARSLRRTTGSVWQVLKNRCERSSLILGLPKSAQQFIKRFDSARSVEPFSFELPI